MPKSPSEILSDPQFQALPLGEQLKVMRTTDPNFAGLPTKQQGLVIAKARQKSLGLDNPEKLERIKKLANAFGFGGGTESAGRPGDDRSA